MNRPARQLDVLIVDDDPSDVLLISEALWGAGHTRSIQVATNGHEAVAYLRRAGANSSAAHPDVVLLDLNMPRMDGHQVLTQIKTDPDLSHIPIIVLTTSANSDDVQTSYSLRANAFVTKPATLDDFTSVIAAIDEFFTRIAALPNPG